MTLPPPPPLHPQEIALFLDYDGTLIPYAGGNLMAPHSDANLPPLLDMLVARTRGAAAIVSGRGIVELDALITPARLPMSGTHGAELRVEADGDIEVMYSGDGLDDIVAAWTIWATGIEGVMLERKHLTFVIHYHHRPDLQDEIFHRADDTCRVHPEFVPQRGNGVVEFKPAGADKGRGITRFMQLEPFAGRRPVFLGDDVPDEAGFAVVQALGGISVRVGPGTTGAHHRLADSAAVRLWLEDLARS